MRELLVYVIRRIEFMVDIWWLIFLTFLVNIVAAVDL